MRTQTKLFSIAAVAALLLIIGCSPESAEDLGTKATAAFSISAVPGKVNTYALQSNSQNAFGF
ncbi:MAG: hypothetical protein ABIR18_05250, partial [Chitinophagaceae bacterium]